MKNYYEILEVHPNASQEVIDKAYKILVRKYHPDVQPKDKIFWAENKIKELTLAYETLSDKKQRDLYDLQTGLKDVSSYYEKYNNLSNLKEKPEDLNAKKTKEKNISIKRKYFKGNYVSYIKNLITKETKKSSKERSKDLKAIILTIIIVTVIVFICIKVPFIKKILFPVG